MSAIVVDASLGVKWFVPEVHADEARQWRNGPDELHAPAFFFDLEIAAVLWKKLQRAEITRADSDLILGQLPALPVTRHPDPPLLASAFDLADRTQRTVYDCLYLALAVQLGGRMVTADQRLFHSLAETAWADFICWVEDLPSKRERRQWMSLTSDYLVFDPREMYPLIAKTAGAAGWDDPVMDEYNDYNEHRAQD